MTSHSWTVDSLRDHLLGILMAHERAGIERTRNLKESVDGRFNDGQRALDIAAAGIQRGVDLALVAQKEALTVALTAAEKKAEAAMASADRAVLKAETATERRFESVNEFRQTLTDQQVTFLPKGEAKALFDGLADKIEIVRNLNQHQAELINTMQAQREGQSKGLASGWGLAVGIVGFVMVVIAVLERFAFRP